MVRNVRLVSRQILTILCREEKLHLVGKPCDLMEKVTRVYKYQ